MTNALGSDRAANEYKLTSTGGNNADISGTDAIVDDRNIIIKAEGNSIIVYNAENHEIAVYTVDGMMTKRISATSNVEKIALAPGLYVVAVENVVEKVIIK